MTPSRTQDTEFTLSWNNHFAVVSPFGASLRRYFVKSAAGEWNVIWGYAGGANKKGGQGDVLIPFPGRIKNGTYAFEGQNHELVKNDKDGPNAIHGFLRTEFFKTESVSDTRAVFSYAIEAETYRARGFPFSLHIEIAYELGQCGLQTSFKIQNVGSASAPVGVGFHPYFRADVGSLENWKVIIPARDYVEIENFIPTGRVCDVERTAFDFRKGRIIGNAVYNGCLAHLERSADGLAYATLQAEGSKKRVVISMDRAFDYVVIYTGDAIPAPDNRQGFAIEPMTCAPDAFNRENSGAHVLKKGAVFYGAYIIRAE